MTNKKFIYKIYNTTDVFVTVLNDVISEPSFSYSINGGLGEITLKLDRKMDDYGEGTDLDFNYRLKIYVTDDTNDSLLIYTGYLVAFKPFLLQGKEGVNVTFLPNIAKLGNDFFRSGTSVKDNFEISKSAVSVEQIMQDIVDNYIAAVTTSMISNDYSNMSATGVDVTNKFRNLKHIEAIREVATFMAYNWYWYINAEGKLYLKQKDATATHGLFLRKQIKRIESSKDIESTVNSYFLWNAEKEGTVVDNSYIDATSVTAYDTIAGLILDGDIVSDAMSNLVGNAKMNANKDVKRKIEIEVTSEQCNLESFKPGDTIKIMDIDASQTIFGTNMMITKIIYNAYRATLELVNTDAAFIRLAQQDAVKNIAISTIEEVTARVETGLNSDANLITDVINARLDSESKKILSDFNFGTTDYAGAVKAGDITWNTTTGALTGGSGVVVYRGGILGANAGVATFSISAVTGAAYFAGQVVATSGDIGGWIITAGYLTSAVEGGHTDYVELKSTGPAHIKALEDTNNYAQMTAEDNTPRFDVYENAIEVASYRKHIALHDSNANSGETQFNIEFSTPDSWSRWAIWNVGAANAQAGVVLYDNHSTVAGAGRVEIYGIDVLPFVNATQNFGSQAYYWNYMWTDNMLFNTLTNHTGTLMLTISGGNFALNTKHITGCANITFAADGSYDIGTSAVRPNEIFSDAITSGAITCDSGSIYQTDVNGRIRQYLMGLRSRAVPPNPAASEVYIYYDSADGDVKAKNSAGTVVTIANF